MFWHYMLQRPWQALCHGHAAMHPRLRIDGRLCGAHVCAARTPICHTCHVLVSHAAAVDTDLPVFGLGACGWMVTCILLCGVMLCGVTPHSIEPQQLTACTACVLHSVLRMHAVRCMNVAPVTKQLTQSNALLMQSNGVQCESAASLDISDH
jgi:hypothetical protein